MLLLCIIISHSVSDFILLSLLFCPPLPPPPRARSPTPRGRECVLHDVESPGSQNIPRDGCDYKPSTFTLLSHCLPICVPIDSTGGMAPQRSSPRHGVHRLQMSGCVGGSGGGVCMVCLGRSYFFLFSRSTAVSVFALLSEINLSAEKKKRAFCVMLFRSGLPFISHCAS